MSEVRRPEDAVTIILWVIPKLPHVLLVLFSHKVRAFVGRSMDSFTLLANKAKVRVPMNVPIPAVFSPFRTLFRVLAYGDQAWQTHN